MRFCRFNDNRLGLVEPGVVRDVTAALDILGDFRYPLPSHDVFVANLDKVAARACEIWGQSSSFPLAEVKLLSPVANPGKIIGAPLNYRKHLAEARADPQIHHNVPMTEIQKIGLFLKANSSLAGAGEGIALRRLERRNDHEVELAVIIGRPAANVARAEALKYVAAYSVGLDITIRGAEERSFRKSADSYTVLGPWMVTADEITDPGNLGLSLSVNGELRQDSNTKFMIMGVEELIEFASSVYTLLPGDIIISGTPEGVSAILPGDEIVASIEKIGTMKVKVRAAETVSATGD